MHRPLRYIPALLAVTVALLTLLSITPRPAHAVTTFTVITTADAGPGSLRQAITNANTAPNVGGPDVINFAIPPGGLQTISPLSPLPDITDSVVIDGTTQSGCGAPPCVVIDGSAAGNANGLTVTVSDSTIRGLGIQDFVASGISVENPNATVVQGNILRDNVVTDNGSVGIRIIGASQNRLWGNKVGVRADGTTAAPNQGGGVIVLGFASPTDDNIIGGTGAGEANMIAMNVGAGVSVRWFGTPNPVPLRNTIRGNSIYANTGRGIDNIGGGNLELPPPVITGIAPLAGTACPNCTIDVYSDNEDEGSIYHGATTADGSGNWTYNGAVSGPNITATATDADGNTSEFSAPFSPNSTDTDGDGCADVEENGTNPNRGGMRDPNNYWDFYDVGAGSPVSWMKDKVIDLKDTVLVLQHFGHGFNAGAYVDPPDNDLDRSVPNQSQSWRTAEADNGIDLVDALASLKQFGHSCTSAP